MTSNRADARLAPRWDPLRGLALLLALGLAGLGRPAPAQAQQPLTQSFRLVDTWTTRPAQSELPVFDRNSSLDVASDDTIYVVDGRANVVFHLDSVGHVLQKWEVDQIGPLKDVAVSSQRVYVLGTVGGAIFNRTGGNRANWVVVGEGLTYDAGRQQVLVSRVVSGEARVQVFDQAGGSLGSVRDDAYSVGTAYDLDVGPDGRVFLAADGSIYAFNVGGATGGLTANALLRLPRNVEGTELRRVAVDGAGRVFTVLANGYYVGWDSAGKLLSANPVAIPGLAGGVDLGMGPGGGTVFSIFNQAGYRGLAYQANRLDFTGEPARWGGSQDSSLGILEGPRRLATGAGGEVFIQDQRSRVQSWSAQGQPRQQWTYSDDLYPGDIGGGGAFPCRVTGLSLDCHGGSADWSQAIPATGWLTAVDGDANLVAALDLADQKVWIYGRDGSPRGSWPIHVDGTFAFISDLAVDGGMVYLADETQGRIDVRNAADGRLLSRIDFPAGPMRIDVQGGASFTLAKDGRVWKHDANGTVLAVFAVEGVSAPNDLAVGAGERVYVADPVRDRVLVYERGTESPGNAPVVQSGRCRVNLAKAAGPDPVEQFSPLTVQLRVSGACPLGDGKVDVALIIDESGSMAGSTISAAQNAALAFLGELNPKGAQVALISFDTSATVLQPLTGDLRQVVRGVGKIKAGGQTNYVDALEKGRAELAGPASRPGLPRIAVMMTDGKPTTTDGLDAAAAALKASGATVYSIGLGPTINDDILRNTVASRPELYYAAPSEGELAAIYRSIAQSFSAARLLTGGVIQDELPADMRYEPGSALPPPDSINGRVLTWSLTEVPASGRLIFYRVRPQQLGRRPTNVEASLDYIDATGESGKALFPVPEVTVIKPKVTANYMPLVSKNSCKAQRADIVLAIDTSGSMLEPAQAGSSQTKLQAAVIAARSFLDNLTFPGDQASIVAFNETARLMEPLSGSRAALNVALGKLTTKTGTRIDRGIEAATAQLLAGPVKRGNKPVIVLLTDGRPTGGTEAEALKDASAARRMGFQIFTIGLGPDLDRTLLTQVAGSASRSFFAADGAALRRIYDQVAGKALCE